MLISDEICAMPGLPQVAATDVAAAAAAVAAAVVTVS